jgi:hypothetical protein
LAFFVIVQVLETLTAAHICGCQEAQLFLHKV